MSNAFLTVGFGREEITPETSVPLQGYGNTLKRMSNNVLDPLYFTCIAVTDTENNTVLLCTVDICNSNKERTTALRKLLSESTGVPIGNILVTATHTHSGPDINLTTHDGINAFYEKYFAAAQRCVKDALDDRVPALMLVGRGRTNKLNFVRQYMAEDGSIVAGGHDGRASKEIPITGYVTEANPTIHLIRFVRSSVKNSVCGVTPSDKKDVIYINWRAHGTKTGGKDKYDISADYPATLRKEVEERLGVLCGYYQGEAGNINPLTKVLSDATDPDYTVYGKQVAEYVIKGLENLKEVKPGTIKTTSSIFEFKANHADSDKIEYAKQAREIWVQTNNYSTVREKFKQYGIYSPYHANAILGRSNFPDTFKCELFALKISDVAFTYLPFEPFDTLGLIVKNNSPFEETLVMGYSCSALGYLPSRVGYIVGCYEADCTRAACGEGEKIAYELVKMLNDIR